MEHKEVGGTRWGKAALSDVPLSSQIADCAVIGIPHERFGEVPKAFVVKSPGSVRARGSSIASALALMIEAGN